MSDSHYADDTQSKNVHNKLAQISCTKFWCNQSQIKQCNQKAASEVQHSLTGRLCNYWTFGVNFLHQIFMQVPAQESFTTKHSRQITPLILGHVPASFLQGIQLRFFLRKKLVQETTCTRNCVTRVRLCSLQDFCMCRIFWTMCHQH